MSDRHLSSVAAAAAAGNQSKPGLRLRWCWACRCYGSLLTSTLFNALRSPRPTSTAQKHTSLFHALPRSRLAQILLALSGVGQDAQEVRQIRDALRGGWLDWLSEQGPGEGGLEAALDGYE